MSPNVPKEDVIEFEESTEDGLSLEKQYVNNCMKKFNILFTSLVENPQLKNAESSIEFRKKGNDIYCAKNHDINKHQEIWNFYTQSITYAPNDSEELALAYGNRSALLYHFKDYEECVKDCDKGICVSNNDFLKAKLLFRKVECLVSLKHETTRKVCEETLEMFKKFDLNADVKDKFVEKIYETFKTVKTKAFKVKKIEKKVESPLTINKQTEAPCASAAIAIKHDETWGRHIVATRKIDPGEILVIEKSYLTTINLDGMYLYCDHCATQTWASIPCENCVYTVYCSEKCKSQAWKINHKHECTVISYLYKLKLNSYPFLNKFDETSGRIYIRGIAAALRLVLKSIHEIGGIHNMKNELIKLESNQDLRKKGFTDDGIFNSEISRSIYSLTSCSDTLDNAGIAVFVTIVCIATYYLARETTFFGKKYKVSPKEMMANENIKFVSALILKSSFLLPVNTLKYLVHKTSTDEDQNYGAGLYAFCSLFNHSCIPNVRSIATKNNERIVYAKHIIEPGQQLFLCYTGESYTSTSKALRTKTLKVAYNVECKCEACEDDWPAALPHIHDILKVNPKIKLNVNNKLKHWDKLKNQVTTSLQNNGYKYDPAVLKNLRRLMKDQAENITVRSKDYQEFDHYIYKMLVNTFGAALNIPDKC